MTISSFGYAGTVNAPQWAKLIPLVGGAQYGVAGSADWKPTIGGAGDRAVTIAVGSGWGAGVMDVSDAAVVKNLTAAAAGVSRWDLIVARRVWGTKLTSFQVVEGGASKVLPPVSATSGAGVRVVNPGTQDEQPIALVLVQGSVIAQIVDLRIWVADGGAVAVDELVLTYTNRLGTQVVIGSSLWCRVTDAVGAASWLKLNAKADTGWVTATLNPEWSPYGESPAWRVVGGVCHLGGRVSGSGAAGPVIFTLPPGARSNFPGDLVFTVDSASGPTTFLIRPSGDVHCFSAVPRNAISLAHISFPVG